VPGSAQTQIAKPVCFFIPQKKITPFSSLYIAPPELYSHFFARIIIDLYGKNKYSLASKNRKTKRRKIKMLLRKKDVDILANELLERTMETQQEIYIAQMEKEFEDEYSSDQIDRIYHRYRYFLRQGKKEV